jgi:hypothetical protein
LEESLFIVNVLWAASCNHVNKPHFLLHTTEPTLFYCIGQV